MVSQELEDFIFFCQHFPLKSVFHVPCSHIPHFPPYNCGTVVVWFFFFFFYYFCIFKLSSLQESDLWCNSAKAALVEQRYWIILVRHGLEVPGAWWGEKTLYGFSAAENVPWNDTNESGRKKADELLRLLKEKFNPLSSLYKSVRVRLEVTVRRSGRAEIVLLKCRGFWLLFSRTSSPVLNYSPVLLYHWTVPLRCAFIYLFFCIA